MIQGRKTDTDDEIYNTVSINDQPNNNPMVKSSINISNPSRLDDLIFAIK